MKRILLVPCLMWLTAACSEDPVASRKEIITSPAPVARPPVIAPVRTPEAPAPAAAEVPAAAPAPTNCQRLAPHIEMPFAIEKPPIMVIGFLQNCSLPSGEKGFVAGSSWTAMGFPCTRGRGRIDKRGGSDNAPNIVNFHMPTSCLMDPPAADEVERVVRQRLKFPSDSKLIAYYPLSIDYWEFVQFSERDVGFSPALFSQSGLSQWQRYLNKNEAIALRLYGRENAWERGKVMYEVAAEIVYESRSTFRLQVRGAKALTADEQTEVRSRCEALRPKRNCEEVFE